MIIDDDIHENPDGRSGRSGDGSDGAGVAGVASFAERVCLAIEATNRWLMAGFVAGESDRLDCQIREEAPRESFRRLLPEIQRLRDIAGIERPEWIATTRGPGSFTGTRISVGAARNLAQLWSIPVRSVSSIALYLYACAREAQAAGAQADQEIAVMIDGKQERVFAAHSTVQAALAGQAIAIVDRKPDEFLTRLYESHPGVFVYADDLDSIQSYSRESTAIETWRLIEPPRAVDLRDLCLNAINAGDVRQSNWSELVPEYLRMDPATSKFNKSKETL
ncbi:MAG: tRNA (adenosine(37)-N6)-threonylcarbamoyltransferase complex dimerization subunit type 1 TsaB [bacterium]|nr:tRNA (adenosine(37)-N6)-threonylcarbamoyltransferase complex dimerization subunit type 1 TsaB [bacterium]